MALQLDKVLDTGVQVSYLRISKIIIDRKLQEITFSVDAFLDQTSRQDGKMAVIDYYYTLSDPTSYNIINNTDIVSNLYNILKTLPDFEGALDV